MRKVDFLKAHIDFYEAYMEYHGIDQVTINIRGSDSHVGIYNDVQLSMDLKKDEIKAIRDALKTKNFDGDMSKLLGKKSRKRRIGGFPLASSRY